MKKQELRIVYRQKRKALSLQEIEKNNDLILINFQKISLPDINCVHSYVPSLKLGEPDTALIIRYLQFKNPMIKVVLPKIDIHSGTMTHFHFTEAMEMVENIYGIHEPKHGEHIDEAEIDLVLIPLLAFDKSGNRVGFGKGFYDKFLGRCKPTTVKAGLSFFGAVDQIDDVSGLDIALDFCVTPDKLYTF